MAKASAFTEIPTTAEKVWQLIGGFNDRPNWLPYIPQSQLFEGGRVRHLLNTCGRLSSNG